MIDIKNETPPYDIFKVLSFIESNEDLIKIYNNNISVDIKLVKLNIKNNIIPNEVKIFTEGIYENIITKRKEYVQSYITILDDVKSEKPLRRYGKVKLLDDIKEQGGTPTDVQRMMLKVNDLKNLVSRLNNLGKTIILGNTDILTDAQSREIIGSIQILENKIKQILK